MSFKSPAAEPQPESLILADAVLSVGEGLAWRSSESSPGQQKRLVKTLERLQPAAMVALAGAAAGHAAPASPSFESILAQLSNA